MSRLNSETLNLLGLLFCGGYSVMLRLAWKNAAPRRQLWSLGSITALAFGYRQFALVYGNLGGAAAALLAGSLTSVAALAWGIEYRSERSQLRRPAVQAAAVSGARRGRAVWGRGCAALLLTPLAANGIGAGLFGVLPGLATDRFSLGLAFVPVLWAVLAVWTICDPSLARPLRGMAAGLAVAGAAIAWSLLA